MRPGFIPDQRTEGLWERSPSWALLKAPRATALPDAAHLDQEGLPDCRENMQFHASRVLIQGIIIFGLFLLAFTTSSHFCIYGAPTSQKPRSPGETAPSQAGRFPFAGRATSPEPILSTTSSLRRGHPGRQDSSGLTTQSGHWTRRDHPGGRCPPHPAPSCRPGRGRAFPQRRRGASCPRSLLSLCPTRVLFIAESL